MEKRPEIAKELACLTTAENFGSSVYSQNEELLKTIQEIGCGADDKRCSEVIPFV